MSKSILTLKGVEKSYAQGTESLSILKNVNLMVNPGEIVGLVGVSGSGKSTLLHMAGLLDHATSGEILLDGMSVKSLDDSVLTRWRNEKIGFIYQFHHLLPEFTALENVMLPHLMGGHSSKEASQKAEDLLAQLDLQDRLTHYPSELSGGEQQRVAVARALINDPALILADEPTGNLDPGTAKKVFDIFVDVARKRNLACLIATHDLALTKKMDRVFHLQDGSIKETR